MGQKVNPIGLRLGVIRGWDSVWYANKAKVADWVIEDRKIRNLIAGQYRDGSLSHVEIERFKKQNHDLVRIKIYTAKPGLVIGRDGEIKKKLTANLKKLTGKEVEINIFEVKLAERNAQIIADSMARKLEARASFRRVQKLAIQRALKFGAKGIKTLVSGRLGGTEIARGEGYAEGQVPLHTLRADIDYAQSEALTKYGILGVKVWVFQGEVMKGQTRKSNLEKQEEKYASKPKEQRKNFQGKKDAKNIKTLDKQNKPALNKKPAVKKSAPKKEA